MMIRYHIQVTGANATVTATHEDGRVAVVDRGHQLRMTKDSVKFTSNDSDTFIRYRSSSPFNEGELGPNKEFEVGSAPAGKGPFVAMKKGADHHFDCGFINPADNKFKSWGMTHGADTPTDDPGSGGPG